MALWKVVTAGASLAILAVSGVSAQERSDVPNGPLCSVTLERTQPDDVFDVTRQIFEDGTCNCFIYTGSPAQSEGTEQRVSRIVSERRCAGARPMRVARGPGQGASAGAGSAASGLLPETVAILIPATALFATGVVIALDGPESP